jgi:hypothetical protein
MKQFILMATLLLIFGASKAQNHIMTYDGSSSGGSGLFTIVGNNIMTYDGSSSGGKGLVTKVDSHLKSYDGSSSGGNGILTFKDPYMSKPIFAAILLAKGIIWSGN